MLDEDNQFLERNIKQGTGEEKSNANTDEDPSRLIRPEVRQGSLPGNQRIRFVRPTHPAFRRLVLQSHLGGSSGRQKRRLRRKQDL